MKTILSIASSILIMTSFIQCSSAQFDKKAPFTIAKASHQNWVGGRPGVKGTLVTIELTSSTSKELVFDSIFFKNKIIKLEKSTRDSKFILTGNFITSTSQNEQLVMHSDSREEMNNKIKNIPSSPFELADNECVISYLVNDKKRYFKLENLKKLKTLFYQ